MEILVLWNKITTQKKSLLHIYFFHFIPKWVEDMDSISSFHTIINHTKAQFIKIHIYNDSHHPSSFSYLCSSFAHYKIEKPNDFTTDVGRGVGGWSLLHMPKPSQMIFTNFGLKRCLLYLY